MTNEIDREDDIALAAEYALGLLTPAEEKAFEACLAVDPEGRVAELVEIRGRRNLRVT